MWDIESIGGDGKQPWLCSKEIHYNDERAAILKDHVLARQRIPAR